MKYSEKLKDPRWQEKRVQILERDDNICYMCQGEGNNVHHLKYYGEPWEVDNKYLITLCYSCHDKWHEAEKYKKLLIDKFSNFHPFIYKDILILLDSIEKLLPRTDISDILYVLAENKDMFSELVFSIYLKTK